MTSCIINNNKVCHIYNNKKPLKFTLVSTPTKTRNSRKIIDISMLSLHLLFFLTSISNVNYI